MGQYILYKLFVTIEWLHGTYKCCHMDLEMRNVVVHGVSLQTDQTTGKLRIIGKPRPKLVDFGVAEIFDTPRNTQGKQYSFDCHKSEGLSIDHEVYCAPETAQGGDFDARGADMWSLGMMMFHLIVGSPLYEADDIWEDHKGGYWAVRNGKLREYMGKKNLLALFKRDSFSLLEALLTVNPRKRIKAKQAVLHPWFKSFNGAGHKNVKKRYNEWTNTEQRNLFPYYK